MVHEFYELVITNLVKLVVTTVSRDHFFYEEFYESFCLLVITQLIHGYNETFLLRVFFTSASITARKRALGWATFLPLGPWAHIG